MFKYLFLLYFSFSGASNNSLSNSLDPTGTYRLGKHSEDKNGDIHGYYGELRVKSIDSIKIVVSFYICKGAPSYNSGSFIDTLEYRNSTAIYRSTYDSSCVVTFYFGKKGVKVNQVAENPNFACGFGHGVIANGSFKKVSQEIPEIVDLTVGR